MNANTEALGFDEMKTKSFRRGFTRMHADYEDEEEL